MNERTNEPAYPASGMVGRGLTIREHFAGLAMQGLLAAGRMGGSVVAQEALIYADALIAALNQGEAK